MMWSFLAFGQITAVADVIFFLKMGWHSGAIAQGQVPWILCGIAIGMLIVQWRLFTMRLQQAQQQLTREQLQNSPQQFRWVLENMPVMLNAFDENGILVVWNQECERVTGYTAAEVVGNPNAMSLFYPDRAYRERMMAEWQQRGNRFRNWEWQLTCKDGTIKPIAWSNIADEFPVPGWAWWGIGTDLSDLKQAQSEQQKAFALFQALFEQTPLVAIQGFDQQGIIRYWNERSTEMYGISQAEAVGQSIQTLLQFQKGADSFLQTLSAIAQTGASKAPQEYQLLTRTGKPIWIYSVVIPIQQNGDVTDLFCMDVDVTEQKQAENALLQSQQRLKLALESAQMGSWEWEIATNQVRWDEGLDRILGLPVGTYDGQFATFLDLVHPADQSILLSAINASLHEGRDYEIELRIIRPTGDIRWVFARGVVIRDATGQPIGMVGLDVDITERKQSELQIQQLNAALEAQNQNLEALVQQRTNALAERTQQLEIINQELESFSYTVSHDLRAPLRHINGFVIALTNQLNTHPQIGQDPKVAHYLQVIAQSSQRMERLIEGLLNLSRVSRCPIHRRPVSIQHLVHQAIQITQSSPNFHPDTQWSIGDLPTVDGDATLLQQVFINLIDNAVKFSRSRTPAQIEISSLPDQTILIKDNGVGFEMTYADQLFGAFQRLHSRTDFEGTGIGLAIVQRIMHRHGGTIRVDSGVDQGTCFYLKFARE